MTEVLIEDGGTWDLRGQLCTDLESMPIEDPSVTWDEMQSPFRTVATLHVPAQIAWEHGVREATEDRLYFAPWHGMAWHAMAAHQPLGSVNRARKDPYHMSGTYRAQFNGCPFHDPAALAELGNVGPAI